MTGSELMAYIGFFLMVVGTLAGFWFRIESKIKVAEDKADKAVSELSSHKIYIAENYLTKQGHADLMTQIMDAIATVRSTIEGLSGRIDRMYDHRRDPS